MSLHPSSAKGANWPLFLLQVLRTLFDSEWLPYGAYKLRCKRIFLREKQLRKCELQSGNELPLCCVYSSWLTRYFYWIHSSAEPVDPSIACMARDVASYVSIHHSFVAEKRSRSSPYEWSVSVTYLYRSFVKLGTIHVKMNTLLKRSDASEIKANVFSMKTSFLHGKPHTIQDV